MKTTRQFGAGGRGALFVTWPLARITVAPGQLTLCILKRFSFAPEEVNAIEPIGFFPVLWHGVQIHHRKSEYPEDLFFLTPWSRRGLCKAIEAAGFRVVKPASFL